MTLREKLYNSLTLARFNVITTSANGDFAIPKGFEEIWTSKDAFFDAVKAQIIRNADNQYFFSLLKNSNENDISPEEYALLEEGIAEHIMVATHSAFFTERLNNYTLEIEQGYKYKSNDVRLVQTTDMIPKTIVAIYNNTGLRPRIEAYDVRKGKVSTDKTITIEDEWQFADNGKKPFELNWNDKQDAASYAVDKTATDNRLTQLETKETSSSAKIAALEDKTQNQSADASSTTFANPVKIAVERILANQDDLEVVQVKALKDALAIINQKDASQDQKITQLQALTNTLGQDLITTLGLMLQIQSEIDTIDSELSVYRTQSGDIYILRGLIDHSTDVVKQASSTNTLLNFNVNYPTSTTTGPNGNPITIIPYRLKSGDRLLISLSSVSGGITSTSPATEVVVGKASSTTINVGSNTYTIDQTKIVDVPSQPYFRLEISKTQSAPDVRLHEIVLEQTTTTNANGMLTQTQANALYAPIASTQLGSNGIGTTTNLVANLVQNWTTLNALKIYAENMGIINVQIDLNTTEPLATLKTIQDAVKKTLASKNYVDKRTFDLTTIVEGKKYVITKVNGVVQVKETTWKDITATYQTRAWNIEKDQTKKVRIAGKLLGGDDIYYAYGELKFLQQTNNNTYTTVICNAPSAKYFRWIGTTNYVEEEIVNPTQINITEFKIYE